jgi:hypothetical protein
VRRRPKSKRDAVSPRELVVRIQELRRQVEPLVPGIDPGDLLLILENWIRGPGSGRSIFLRQVRRGVYVI